MGGERGRLLFEILLIRHASLGQKGHCVSGQKFKFRISSISTKHGYIQVTGDCIVNIPI